MSTETLTQLLSFCFPPLSPGLGSVGLFLLLFSELCFFPKWLIFPISISHKLYCLVCTCDISLGIAILNFLYLLWYLSWPRCILPFSYGWETKRNHQRTAVDTSLRSHEDGETSVAGGNSYFYLFPEQCTYTAH